MQFILLENHLEFIQFFFIFPSHNPIEIYLFIQMLLESSKALKSRLQSKIYSSPDRQKEIAEITPVSVTQGKTYHTEERFAAAHAIDKDLSTVAATTTDDGAGWMKIEFDKTYFIHKVDIFYIFYTNWYDPSTNFCAKSEANFRSCLDIDNNVDVSVYQGELKQKSCGTLQLTYGLEQSDQIYTLICNSGGDTVRLSKEASEGLSLITVAEIAVTTTGKYFVNITTDWHSE